MPFADINGNRTFYEVEGQSGRPFVLLSHSLGVTSAVWDAQMSRLLSSYRVVRYDARGHGQTAIVEGPYSISQLGEDVVCLMDHLDIASAHFCGLSMGGMIGLWLAVKAPGLVNKLVLANTAARIGTVEGWNERIATVTQLGVAAIVDSVLERWFTPEARLVPALIEPVRAMLLTTSPAGYTGCCAAIRDMDQRSDVPAIIASTLVLAGSDDSVTPPSDARFLADSVPRARLIELRAAHLSNVEAASEFTNALMSFLSEELYER